MDDILIGNVLDEYDDEAIVEVDPDEPFVYLTVSDEDSESAMTLDLDGVRSLIGFLVTACEMIQGEGD